MRINLYLSETNEKDIIIANMLNSKYSPKDYIKETLYGIATGQTIIPIANKKIDTQEDEYEAIEDLDGIDI